MAGLAELKKQERTLKARPRTNSPSYLPDESKKLNHESTSKSELKETTTKNDEIEPVSSIKEVAEPKTVEPTPEIKPEIKEESPVQVVEEKPIKAEKLVEESKPKAPQKETKIKEEVVKSVTVRLVDIDDADFLKYACKAKGMNMQEFFWSIMENDIKNNTNINPRDEEHMTFKSITLPEIRTIPIPKSLKESISANAGKHRLPDTRYMALTIHKARLADPGWN